MSSEDVFIGSYRLFLRSLTGHRFCKQASEVREPYDPREYLAVTRALLIRLIAIDITLYLYRGKPPYYTLNAGIGNDMSFDLNATAIEPDDSTIEGLVQELENKAAQKAVI